MITGFKQSPVDATRYMKNLGGVAVLVIDKLRAGNWVWSLWTAERKHMVINSNGIHFETAAEAIECAKVVSVNWLKTVLAELEAGDDREVHTD